MSLGKDLTRGDKRDTGIFARLRNRLFCLVGKHEPNRNKVRRTTGVYFAGVCRYCGTTIRKRHGHPWRAVSPDEVDLPGND
jgi:hypothetical protein